MFPINRGPTLIVNLKVTPGVIKIHRKFYSPIFLFASVTDLRSFFEIYKSIGTASFVSATDIKTGSPQDYPSDSIPLLFRSSSLSF